MKNIIVSFIVLLLTITLGCDNSTELNFTQGEWKLIYKNQTTNYYHGIYFADLNNGWVVGDSSKILHTKDGGNSWILQECEITEYLKCVFFANTQKGWIGGGNNSIGTTTNGGVTWTWQHPSGESRRTFMAMSFINDHIGWIVDNYGGILHTKDGGITWIQQNSGTSWAITAVQFLDNNEGWATATNRVVLHTTNGGNNWTVSILDNLDYNGATIIYEDIYFYDHSRGWIATNAGASSIAYPHAPIIHTSNNGRTWNCISTTNQTKCITSIQFINENLGWAASENGILYTNNGGESWFYQFENNNNDDIFIDICFIDQAYGWALTFRGDVFKYRVL